MSFLFYLTMILFLFVCLFLILLVLIQKGRGGGLASAFGGAGGNTAFGSKTGDVLTWATSIVFGIFLVLGVTLNLLANHRHQVETGAAATDAFTTETGLPPLEASDPMAVPQPQVPPPTGLPPGVSGDQPAPGELPPVGPTSVEPVTGAAPAPTTQP